MPSLRQRLMLSLVIMDIHIMDSPVTDMDTVFLDVALLTLEVTSWAKGQLRLNLHIMDLLDTIMDLMDILMDFTDTVLSDLVLQDTHLVLLSPTEVSKVWASKTAKSGTF